MSGIEVASIVLGALPLVVSTLDKYNAATETLSNLGRKNQQDYPHLFATIRLANSSLQLLEVQKGLLNRELRQLPPSADLSDDAELDFVAAAVTLLRRSTVTSIAATELLSRIGSSRKSARPQGQRLSETVDELQDLLCSHMVILNTDFSSLLENTSSQAEETTVEAQEYRECLPQIHHGRKGQSDHTADTPMTASGDNPIQSRAFGISRIAVYPNNETQKSGSVDTRSLLSEETDLQDDDDVRDDASVMTADTEIQHAMDDFANDFHNSQSLKSLIIHPTGGPLMAKTVLLDTGAGLNFISKQLADELGKRCRVMKLPKTKRRNVLLGNGSSIKPRLVVEMTWSFEGKDKIYGDWLFVVVDDMPHDTIIGRPSIFKFEFMYENLGTCPLGLSEDLARRTEMLVFGLSEQEKAVKAAQALRKQEADEQARRDRDDWYAQEFKSALPPQAQQSTLSATTSGASRPDSQTTAGS